MEEEQDLGAAHVDDVPFLQGNLGLIQAVQMLQLGEVDVALGEGQLYGPGADPSAGPIRARLDELCRVEPDRALARAPA